jgi:hypothetical protein
MEFSLEPGTWYLEGNVKAVVEGLKAHSNVTFIVSQYFSNKLYKHLNHWVMHPVARASTNIYI